MIYVYGLFKPSLVLELGLNALHKEGFAKQRMLVVALEPGKPGDQKLLDAMYDTDGMSLLDGVAVSASIGMALGVIYGSAVHIGPIALGLIGMVGGGGLGFLLDRWIRRNKRFRYAAPAGEVIVAVCCEGENEASRVETIMREHRAAALGRGPAPITETNK